MYLIRDILHCKPGQVRPMVEKFKALSKSLKSMGYGSMRVSTDLSAERYWTVVAEMEAKSLAEYEEAVQKTMADKKLAKVMDGYHDLVTEGRREIYKIE